jgi:predicted lipoprotein with Yx(FWY)xxD motif
MRTSRLAVASLLSLAALLAAGCGTTAPTAGAAYGTATPASSPSASVPASSTAAAAGAPMIAARAVLTVRKTKIGDVLATATGMTVYWYSHDVRGSGKSACSGGCLTAWPAVTGTPVAGAGVTLNGKLGTITRSGGVVQATYNGYPLYTYAADVSAGQTLGNGLGGVWHVITGADLSSSTTPSSGY